MNTRLTFKEFLTEVMMDVDLADPNAAVTQVRQAARKGPVKASREEAIRAKAEKDVAAQTGEEQTPGARQESMLKQRLAQIQQRNAMKQKQQQQQGQ